MSIRKIIEVALSSISSGASAVESVQNIESHLSANLSAKYCPPCDGVGPSFLIKNSGEHHASNVRISSKPALNFCPYEGENIYIIPKLASGETVKVSFFPTVDPDLRKLELTIKYLDGHNLEQSKCEPVMLY